jgi:hypothetical protein
MEFAHRQATQRALSMLQSSIDEASTRQLLNADLTVDSHGVPVIAKGSATDKPDQTHPTPQRHLQTRSAPASESRASTLISPSTAVASGAVMLGSVAAVNSVDELKELKASPAQVRR